MGHQINQTFDRRSIIGNLRRHRRRRRTVGVGRAELRRHQRRSKPI